MGNSTISLASVFDWVAARGIPDPRGGASGYGDDQALIIANQIIADLICERFNWKWNRATAAAFYTNSYQQDYPQPAQEAGNIGWGEDGDVIDINNTSQPQPLQNIKWRRGLSRTNVSRFWPQNLCWMYNGELSLGVWPGPSVTYYPLVTTAGNQQNPIMSMKDANGNILIVTGFGTTAALLNITQSQYTTAAGQQYLVLTFTGATVIQVGNVVPVAGTNIAAINGNSYPVTASSAGSVTLLLGAGSTAAGPVAQTGTIANPACLPATSVEGTTVTDGTVVWTCVSANSQGFRLDRLPSASGPTLQVIPYYQLEPPTFTAMSQLINPIPDSFSRFFFRGIQSECLMASVNPGDMKRGEQMKAEWLNALMMAIKQGNRELDAYALQPVTSPVEPYYGPRQPRTPDNPYGWNWN